MLLNSSPICEGCVQCDVGERRVETDGRGTNGVLICGESPWKDEVREGKPFAGASGRLLDKVFRGIGVKRESFLIANAGIWCRPPQLSWIDNPKRFPDAALALAHCRPHIDGLVAAYKPKVIVPLGNVALERICGVSGIESRQAYVHDSLYTQEGFPIPAVPTFHPSYVMQGKHKFINAVSFAFRRALEVAQQSRAEPNGVYARYTTEYYTDITVEVLRTVLAEAAHAETIAVDIETPKSSKLNKGEDEEDPSYTIVRVGISWAKGKALSIPFRGEYLGLLREFFSQPTTVNGRPRMWVLWNGSFDRPRLVASGTPLVGACHDAMWAWHFLQSDLPKALDFVAPFFTDLEYWAAKADSDPAYYNATDCDATLRIYEGVKEALIKQQRWEVWLRHCVEAGSVFEAMGVKGIRLDLEAQSKLKVMLEEDFKIAYDSLQQVVPVEVKPLKVWKKAPKSKEGCTSILIPCPACAICGVDYPKLKDGRCKRCHGERQIVEWSRRGAFNPSSSQQVAKLIKHFKLKMPKKRGEDRETTESKYLRRFGKKHKVFKDVLDCRKRSKLISAYLWVPNAKGRITTHYAWHPSTWRKSSRNVNLQVIPKRFNTPREKEVVQQIKKTLVAEDGCVLVEADSTSIEAVLVGYWAGDADYIKLAKAGVHGYLMSDVVGERIDPKLPLKELQVACKAMKSRDEMLYDTCKRCVHGSNYGLTPFGMCDEFEENFPTVKIAKEFQDRYLGLFPKITDWMRTTRERVSKEHYLDNHYGYRHYFYDVFQWDWRRKVWVLGEDGKRVVAFGPQSDASAIQTEDILELSRRIAPLLRLIIHDSTVCEAPVKYADTVAWELQRVMTRPRPELGGLVIGAEVKIGRSLGEMKEWQPTLNVVGDDSDQEEA